jgi:hypothetical protein
LLYELEGTLLILKKLTKPMQRGLLKVFKEKTVEGINKSTLKALQDRGLIDDFSVITSNGYTYRNEWPDLTLIKDNEVLFPRFQFKVRQNLIPYQKLD